VSARTEFLVSLVQFDPGHNKTVDLVASERAAMTVDDGQ
jgi:hypothetical protein